MLSLLLAFALLTAAWQPAMGTNASNESLVVDIKTL